MMWICSFLILSILPAASLTTSAENNAEELLSKFNAIVETPISKDIGKLRKFRERLSEFTKSLIPVAEHFANSPDERKSYKDLMSNISSQVTEDISYMLPSDSVNDVSIDFYYFLREYEETVTRPLNHVFRNLDKISRYNTTHELQLDTCRQNPEKINRAIDKLVGTNCLNKKFSPKAASILFELIDAFEYVNYTLTKKEDALFKPLFSELYNFFDARNHLGTSSFSLQMFLRDKKGFVYKNKVKMLEDLVQLLDTRYNTKPNRDCLPMSAFLITHFNNDIWLRLGDAITTDLYAAKFVTYMCANITHTGDPEGAGRFVAASEEILQPVYFVLTEWFESLMESTWPTTETELIREFMKEASGGQPIAESSAEYQKTVTFVHDKMKSIGHPGYTRHFVLTKEYSGSSDNYNFDMKCKKNACSRVVAVGVQCVTLRLAKDKTENGTIVQKFLNFTEELKPKLLEAIEKENTKNLWYAPTVADQLYSEHGVTLTVFSNHSSYLMLHHSEYGSKCSVLYEQKFGDEESTSSLHTIRYHNDGGTFSDCHDWVFFLGL